ncbi:EcsC family protein [Evansella sp. AB-rgal1]|uniref:EcsC family protein n=1 Tax=Evansella sp. AB-rgal1 TaxID=3242696 RepID=UPI00359D7FD2
MSWSEREQQVWSEIARWEEQQFSNIGTDFSRTYQKLVKSGFHEFGGNWSHKMLTKLDDMLFHLQAIVQQGRFDEQARDHLLTQARIFRSDIYSIQDMKKLSIDQLRFIAKKQLARQRLTALAQGGITGIGGLAFFLSDLPFMLAINLRTTQLVALTYGYDMRKPYEMMLVLKVFHAISLPRSLQGEAWNYLYQEISNIEDDVLFYDGEEDITTQAWMQRPLNNILKLFFLSFARKKLIQGIPVFSIAVGAASNYNFAKEIATSSHYFYQKRWLLEKS